MANLFENLPYSLNNEFRGYLVYNFKLLNQNQLIYERLLDSHKEQSSGAHTTSQINHKDKPLDKKIDALEGRINNQIYGASKNSSAEVKDLRVGNDGTVYDLAQSRILNDFSKIDAIAKRADNLAQELESEANQSAYYNEITYISGRKFDTTYKIVHIPYRDSDGNVIQIRKGISGSNPSRPDHITPRQFSKQKGATFVSNASTGSGSTLKLHGQQIYNGQILDSDKDYSALQDRWTLAMKDDNTMTAFPQSTTAQQIKDMGYNNTWSGFGPLIMEGTVVYSTGDYSPNSEVSHPRTVVAQLPNKDTLIFTCEGRIPSGSLKEKGMTLPEVTQTLYAHYGDIQFAYNLDGGGSSSSVLRSRMLNDTVDEGRTMERNVLDFIYVGKDPKQIRDKDIQKAYEDIGDVRKDVQKVMGMLVNFNEINGQELRLLKHTNYTGLVAMDGDTPKQKFYMQPGQFRFWDYGTGRTWFRVTDDSMELHNRELARNFSAPESVTNCNNLAKGGTYHVPKTATGSPYPNQSSAMVTQYNVTYSDASDAATVFQTAVPFARSANYKMKRRTYAQGAWSQWFDV